MRDEMLDTPNLIEPRFFMPWHHELEPPFRVQKVHWSGHGNLATWETWAYIDPAIVRFREVGLPVRPGWAVMVMDRSHGVILGYSAYPHIVQQIGTEAWYGVREAFEVAEAHGLDDPMHMAIWEGAAMRTAR